jgi:hypothetical protein
MSRWRPILEPGQDYPAVLERIGGSPLGLPEPLASSREAWHFVGQFFLKSPGVVDGESLLLYVFQMDYMVEVDWIRETEVARSNGSYDGLAITGWTEETEIFSEADAIHYLTGSFDRFEDLIDWTAVTYRGGVRPCLMYEPPFGPDCEFIIKFKTPPEDELLPSGFDVSEFPHDYSGQQVTVWRSLDGRFFGIWEW